MLPSYVGKCFEVTEKLHGSSMTVYFYEGEFGVCSRNIDLKETETNSYWKTAHDQNLFKILEKMYDYSGHYYALQGEMIGEGINGNMYGIKGQMFKLFDIYDITDGHYLDPIERMVFWNQVCREGDGYHVPTLNRMFNFEEFHTVDQLLKVVEHKSTLNPKVWSEGWVMKCHTEGISFKVVSNKFLCTDYGDDS
jgi:RNA ligase (TIGR02306 family)